MKLWWKSIGILGFQSRWWSFLRFVCSYLESLFHGDSYSILGSTLSFQLWKCLKKCLLLKAKFEGLRVKWMRWSQCLVFSPQCSSSCQYLSHTWDCKTGSRTAAMVSLVLSVGRKNLPFLSLAVCTLASTACIWLVFEGSLPNQVQLLLHQSPQVLPGNLSGKKLGQKREFSISVFNMSPRFPVPLSRGAPIFIYWGFFRYQITFICPSHPLFVSAPVEFS